MGDNHNPGEKTKTAVISKLFSDEFEFITVHADILRDQYEQLGTEDLLYLEKECHLKVHVPKRKHGELNGRLSGTLQNIARARLYLRKVKTQQPNQKTTQNDDFNQMPAEKRVEDRKVPDENRPNPAREGDDGVYRRQEDAGTRQMTGDVVPRSAGARDEREARRSHDLPVPKPRHHTHNLLEQQPIPQPRQPTTTQVKITLDRKAHQSDENKDNTQIRQQGYEPGRVDGHQEHKDNMENKSSKRTDHYTRPDTKPIHNQHTADGNSQEEHPGGKHKLRASEPGTASQQGGLNEDSQSKINAKGNERQNMDSKKKLASQSSKERTRSGEQDGHCETKGQVTTPGSTHADDSGTTGANVKLEPSVTDQNHEKKMARVGTPSGQVPLHSKDNAHETARKDHPLTPISQQSQSTGLEANHSIKDAKMQPIRDRSRDKSTALKGQSQNKTGFMRNQVQVADGESGLDALAATQTGSNPASGGARERRRELALLPGEGGTTITKNQPTGRKGPTLNFEMYAWMWAKEKYKTTIKKLINETSAVLQEQLKGKDIYIRTTFSPTATKDILQKFKSELTSIALTAESKGIFGKELPDIDVRPTAPNLQQTYLVQDPKGNFHVVSTSMKDAEKYFEQLLSRKDVSGSATSNNGAQQSSQEFYTCKCYIDQDMWIYYNLDSIGFIEKLKTGHALHDITGQDAGGVFEVTVIGEEKEASGAVASLEKKVLFDQDLLRREKVRLQNVTVGQEKIKQILLSHIKEHPEVYIKQHGQEVTIIGVKQDAFQVKNMLLQSFGITQEKRVRRMLTPSSADTTKRHPVETEGRPTTAPPRAMHHNPNISDESFRMTSGSKIHIFRGDITKLQVSAIVNAANEYLDHGAGVARAISAAAGKGFNKCCRELVKKSGGKITLSKPVVTPPFNLPCKHVMHVVGPQWQHYNTNQKDHCRDTLRTSFYNCLKEAESRACKSIAIPAVSSGVYGVPPPIVAKEMLNAVYNYNQYAAGSPRCVTDIILVDINPDMVRLIQQEFTQFCKKHPADMKRIVSERHLFDLTFQPPAHTRGVVTSQPQASSVHPPLYSEVTSGQSATDGASRRHEGANVKLHGAKGAMDVRPEAGQNTWDERPQGNRDKAGTISINPGAITGKTNTQVAPPSGHQDETCTICMETPTDPKVLKCKHVFCTECIDGWFREKPTCPSCGQVFGEMRGNQPPGTMDVKTLSTSLPGYQKHKTIEITYNFKAGKQTYEHPNPGARYKGTKRVAYLPDNKEGREIRQLLRRAFDARLVFTIGRSTTTGAEDQITWNDVHHKTNQHGGPEKYGYPDKTYLTRVKSELADKGIK